MSRMRFLSRALRACQAGAAELVELHVALVGAVAAEYVDVLDRHEQLVVARGRAAADNRAARRRPGW